VGRRSHARRAIPVRQPCRVVRQHRAGLTTAVVDISCTHTIGKNCRSVYAASTARAIAADTIRASP
jgi:hypothetical protein